MQDRIEQRRRGAEIQMNFSSYFFRSGMAENLADLFPDLLLVPVRVLVAKGGGLQLSSGMVKIHCRLELLGGSHRFQNAYLFRMHDEKMVPGSTFKVVEDGCLALTRETKETKETTEPILGTRIDTNEHGSPDSEVEKLRGLEVEKQHSSTDRLKGIN